MGHLRLGITLTLQQVAKDAASTLLLFATRPFDVGDTIDAGGGHYGIVKQVDVRHTEITLFSSNQVVSIPNTKLAECRIENYSRMGADTRRTTINVAVHLKTRWRSCARCPRGCAPPPRPPTSPSSART